MFPSVRRHRVGGAARKGDSASAEGANTGILHIGDSEIEILTEWMIDDGGSEDYLQIMCGRLSRVFNFEMESEYSILSFWIIAAGDRGRDIGSQLPFGGVFRVSQLTLTSVPQFVGGPPEREREYGNQECCEGSNGTFIAMNKDTETILSPTENDREIGNTLVKSVFCFIVLCLVNAVLKRI